MADMLGYAPEEMQGKPVLAFMDPDAQAAFAANRERRQQEAHAVRFHPQGELEGVGRHHFPVVRAVGVGRSVERRAGALQRLEEAAIVMLRPLEHQMLEQVRETGMSRMFVLRSDVVPDVDRDDRTRVILVQEHVESIAQRVLRVRQLHLKLPHVSIELP